MSWKNQRWIIVTFVLLALCVAITLRFFSTSTMFRGQVTSCPPPGGRCCSDEELVRGTALAFEDTCSGTSCVDCADPTSCTTYPSQCASCDPSCDPFGPDGAQGTGDDIECDFDSLSCDCTETISQQMPDLCICDAWYGDEFDITCKWVLPLSCRNSQCTFSCEELGTCTDSSASSSYSSSSDSSTVSSLSSLWSSTSSIPFSSSSTPSSSSFSSVVSASSASSSYSSSSSVSSSFSIVSLSSISSTSSISFSLSSVSSASTLSSSLSSLISSSSSSSFSLPSSSSFSSSASFSSYVSSAPSTVASSNSSVAVVFSQSSLSTVTTYSSVSSLQWNVAFSSPSVVEDMEQYQNTYSPWNLSAPLVSVSSSSFSSQVPSSPAFVYHADTSSPSIPDVPPTKARMPSVSGKTERLPSVVCGNGIMEHQEECDDGVINKDAPNSCRTNCSRPRCGDRILDSSEQCDDGNTIDADLCGNSCMFTFRKGGFCGDGIIQPGRNEQCDAGSANAFVPSACRPTCVAPFCGDGIVDATEQCDDGNNASYDGCSGFCLFDRALPQSSLNPAAMSSERSEERSQMLQDRSSQKAEVRNQWRGYNAGEIAGGYTSGNPWEGTILPASIPPATQTQTGPGLVILIATGAAAGIGYVRRKIRGKRTL